MEGAAVGGGVAPTESRFRGRPRRPEGTGGMGEDERAGLVTRDSMIGTGLALDPATLEMSS